jgi:hypothetical protein
MRDVKTLAPKGLTGRQGRLAAIVAARQSVQDGYHVVSRARLFDRIIAVSPSGIAFELSPRHRCGRFCDGFLIPAARQSGLEANRAGP